MKKVFVIITLSLTILSCSVSSMVKKYIPKISFKSLKFKSIDLKGFTLEMTMNINNDKVDKPIVIVKNEYLVAVEKKHLMKVKNNKAVTFPPKKNVDYKQDIYITYKRARSLLKLIFNKDKMLVELKGVFYVNVASRKLEVPIQQSFKVKVPKFPKISLSGISFAGFNKVILNLKIQNRTPVFFSISSSRFKVLVSGKKLLNAKTGRITLKINKAVNIRVPVSFNIVNALSIVSKLKNWKKLKIKLIGYFEIRTLFGKIRIPFKL